jgi:hypothetical protein
LLGLQGCQRREQPKGQEREDEFHGVVFPKVFTS